MSHDPRAADGAPEGLSPLPARAALDAYFLEARAKLLDLAAILDRVDRGGGVDDPRLAKVRQALAVLGDPSAGRAERVQRFFSLDYEAGWEQPRPR
jgi:hypothetical protein